VIGPLEFYSHLAWIDGQPLLDTIEPYRRRILAEALFTFDGGRPRYNLVLCGRAKKNWKTSDLILAAFYRFFVWQSGSGNDCFLLANDEGQAADDLSLAKKLIWANPILAHEVEVRAKSIERLDGRGTLRILPAGDAVGAHGKTYLFVGFDEIHGYKSWDLLEALAPDPTRSDALTWISTYDTIYNAPGVPLFDLKRQADRDPRMFLAGTVGTCAPIPISWAWSRSCARTRALDRGLRGRSIWSSRSGGCRRRSIVGCIFAFRGRRTGHFSRRRTCWHASRLVGTGCCRAMAWSIGPSST
jgi:hypothetical protein